MDTWVGCKEEQRSRAGKREKVILTSDEGGSNVNDRCVRGEDRVKEDLALSIRTEVDCPEKDTMQLDIVIITVH